MASAEHALYARLQAVTGVTDLVSTRVFPLRDDTGDPPARPYVMYERLGTTPKRTLTGKAYSEINLRLYMTTDGYDAGLALSSAVEAALDDWSGSSGGVTVLAVMLVTEFDLPSDTPGVIRRVADYEIWTDEGA